MIGTRAEELLRHVQQDVPDDAELVRRFRGGDPAAFESVVRRHGPLVLAVCLRTTNHRQDAEDAFQATFLTLARKAELIRDPHLLGNWLHGTAVRIGMRAKRGAARRRKREVQAVNVPEPAATALEPRFEHESAIHEEIERLPDAMRDAVVLCELRGVPRSEAAALLRIPEGTLSSRLAAGRKKLAERLTRRGIVPGAALVSLAAVPESLIAATSRIAAGIAVPANIERLVRGGFPMRSATIVVLGFSLSMVAAVYGGSGEETAPPVAKAPVASAEPKLDVPPAAKVDYTTKPRLQKTMDLQPNVHGLAWSPDGKWLIVNGPSVVFWDIAAGSRAELNLGLWNHFVGITPDSKHVVTVLRESGLLSGLHAARFWKITGPAKGGAGPMGGGGFRPAASREYMFEQTKELAIDPETVHQYGFPADGESIRTIRLTKAKSGMVSRVEVFEVKFGEAEGRTVFATDGECDLVALSPSGGRVALMNNKSITLHDIAGKKKTVFDQLPVQNPLKENTQKRFAKFSPDESKLITSLGGRSPVILSVSGDKPVVLEELAAHSIDEREATFSPNNRLVAIRGARDEKKPGEPLPGPGPSVRTSYTLSVWDAHTGKIVKSWDYYTVAAFHPSKPLLAIVEPNGGGSRLGFWDFSAESVGK